MTDTQQLPAWALAMEKKIDDLRKELDSMRRNRWEYYDFVNRFRRFMRPDPDRNHYPEVIVGKRRIGVTFDGLLYDKESGNTLERVDAFDVYKTLYNEYRRSLKR